MGDDAYYLIYQCLECNYVFRTQKETYICLNCGSYDLEFYDESEIIDIIYYKKGGKYY